MFSSARGWPRFGKYKSPFRLETSRRIDHIFATVRVVFAFDQLVSFSGLAETKRIVDKKLDNLPRSALATNA
jgi:hypothetical protein